jgi:hypothetical protein
MYMYMNFIIVNVKMINIFVCVYMTVFNLLYTYYLVSVESTKSNKRAAVNKLVQNRDRAYSYPIHLTEFCTRTADDGMFQLW